MITKYVTTVGGDLRTDAAKVMNVRPEDLGYYSWPEAFGSTAGPFGGIGGQAITTFQVEAFHLDDTGEAVLYCNGRLWKKVKSLVLATPYERKLK